MATLNEDARNLLSAPLLAWMTTLRADGSPHNTVVWVDVDGNEVIVNTAVGRAKEKNIRRDPRVSVSVLDPADPYRMVSVSGSARLVTDGADDVIDQLAKKYLGAAIYPFRRPDEQRVTVRITPEKVVHSPGSGG